MFEKIKQKLIVYLKRHPHILACCWKIIRGIGNVCTIFIPKQKKVIFNSYGGRKFDDSPKAIYDELRNRVEFKKWDFVWAFTEPGKHKIPEGRKVKIDTLKFFYELLSSSVWVGNSGIDRGIGFSKYGKIIEVDTWHGTPLKKIGGDENKTSMLVKKKNRGKLDSETIRCAQSEYDRMIFERIFHATEDSFLMCDLPRNDGLLRYTEKEQKDVRSRLKIPEDKSVILYAPTYREYLVNRMGKNFLAPPISLEKWKDMLCRDYVLLVRAHYAVSEAMGIKDDEFVRDVSEYPYLNDLYAVSDVLISDYSSVYIDYSILERPMFCFAYDLEEYARERGLYMDLKKELPCTVHEKEDSLLEDIVHMDYGKCVKKSRAFHMKYAPYAGNSCNVVVDEMIKRLKGYQ